MSVVIIAEAVFIQISLFWSSLNLETKSLILFDIFSAGNVSPITPVEAKIRSLIFTVSDMPSSFF